MNKDLIEKWLQAKQEEQEAVAKRRELEDMMSVLIGLEETQEGSKTHKVDGYKVKVTQRMNRTIDSEKLDEIVHEEGLEDVVGVLFRTKMEVNKKEWDSADESLTKPLSKAITLKAGRPSYSILEEEK